MSAQATCAGVQLFPPLDAATEAALRASIERFGVLVPVVQDQHGRILDGHHRQRIASELDVKYPVRVQRVAGEDEAREIARTLNTDRRHLTPEQRRPMVIALREEGHSQRAIARALGFSQPVIHSDLKKAADKALSPERVSGQDGKSYPATKPKSEPEPEKSGSRRPPRPDKTASFEITNERGRIDSNSNKRRLMDGLAEVGGLCHGLLALDYGKAAAVMAPEEVRAWVNQVDNHLRALRQIRSNLQEASRNGEHA